jgi:dihydrofolate reductase/predicted transcriptional regulator
MKVHLPPDVETRLLASEQGRDTAALVHEAVTRLVDYDEWFSREVDLGIAAANRSEFVEHEEVRKLVEKALSGMKTRWTQPRGRVGLAIYNRGMARRVILGLGLSLDGYIARRNGDLDFLAIDKEGEAVMADFFSKIDTTIMGRKTAAGWVKMRERGEIPETPGMANYVVSRRWKPGKRDGFEVVNGSLTALVRKLKRRQGKDIYLGGGGGLVRSFLREDLVDELFLGVGPVLLGDGIPGFPAKFPQRDFRLTECKAYSNGSVGLRYVRGSV